MTKPELLAFFRSQLPRLQHQAKILAEAISQNLPVFTQVGSIGAQDQVRVMFKEVVIPLAGWHALERRRFPVPQKAARMVLEACRRMGKLLDEIRRRFDTHPDSAAGLVNLTQAVGHVRRDFELILEHYGWEGRLPAGRELGRFAASPKPIASARLTTLLYDVRSLDKALEGRDPNPLLSAHLAALGGAPKGRKPATSKREPGRPERNADLVGYALGQREREAEKGRRLTDKENLRRCRRRFPNHTVFKARNPLNAFRAALGRAKAKDTSPARN